MEKLKCDRRKDPVARKVRDITAAEMVAWMVEHHGLPAGSAEIVSSNLREQMLWHRLQGRLDQNCTARIVAQLMGMRNNPMLLNRKPKLAYQTLDEAFREFLTANNITGAADGVMEMIKLAFAANWKPELKESSE